MQLNTQQSHVVRDVFVNKNNIFLTGEAGCGKSETIKYIIRHFTNENLIGITAMTGRAAILIHGKTLHSFLGIGLGTGRVDEWIAFTTTKNKKIYNNLLKLQLLIIDEISMLDANLFDKISLYLQRLRSNLAPFGGIQIILCGDPFQLRSIGGEYFFKADEWSRLNLSIHVLTEKFRQSEDTTFQDILSEVRWGTCSDETYTILKATKHNQFPIEPTKLYSLNADIDLINTTRFEEVKANAKTVITYKLSILNTLNNTPILMNKEVEKIINAARIQQSITLCEGLQVVVTWNIPTLGLVNGSRAEIISLNKTSVTLKLVDSTIVNIGYFDYIDDKLKLMFKFIPLRLAYALSIHSAQGMTLDCVEMNLGSSIFEYGQAYTALSRAKNLNSIRITHLKKTSFKTHPDVIEFAQKIQKTCVL